MIKEITVNAIRREGVGKGPARRLRAQGMIPVSVYGEGEASLPVAVSAKELAGLLRSATGHNTIFKLTIPGMEEPANVIIKDWQTDPVKGRLLHADLMRLSMTVVTRVSVPIVVVGEPVGVKLEGGILEINLREVEVECLPGDIPATLEVDVADLHLGKHVSVVDLKVDLTKIKVLTPEDQIVAGVLAPRLVEEVAPAPEAAEPAAAEPEVIKKGKAEESAE
jgi:large subunit ribosomal protein L25